MRLQPDSLFAGVWRIDALLGQGAMGAVYRAHDERTGEPVALKVMKRELGRDEELARRFAQEARIGAEIDSEHVTKVHATGVDEETGMPWLAMELLVGHDLGHWLGAHTPSEATARELVRQLFDAVGAAHRARVVHRDLKPENVFVVEDDPRGPRIKVLDFGVAKIVRDQTFGGTVPGLGTPLWTAPEQARAGQKIRPSADVWALALLTFRILVGAHFWRAVDDPKATAYDLAIEVTRGPQIAPSERAGQVGRADRLPPGFDAWFARCSRKAADERFATADDAFAELAPLLEPREAPAAPAATPSRSGGTLALALALAIAAGAGLAWVLTR